MSETKVSAAKRRLAETYLTLPLVKIRLSIWLSEL